MSQNDRQALHAARAQLTMIFGKLAQHGASTSALYVESAISSLDAYLRRGVDEPPSMLRLAMKDDSELL